MGISPKSGLTPSGFDITYITDSKASLLRRYSNADTGGLTVLLGAFILDQPHYILRNFAYSRLRNHPDFSNQSINCPAYTR
jgi:hypothetical protein